MGLELRHTELAPLDPLSCVWYNERSLYQTQLSGSKGASSVCRNSKPISVTRVFKHANVKAAKKAETKRYHSTKAILGANKVRGAGHTKAFPKKK